MHGLGAGHVELHILTTEDDTLDGDEFLLRVGRECGEFVAEGLHIGVGELAAVGLAGDDLLSEVDGDALVLDFAALKVGDGIFLVGLEPEHRIACGHVRSLCSCPDGIDDALAIAYFC